MSSPSPVRVAAVNDYELVVDGVARLLGRFPDRIEVCDRIVLGEPIAATVDVALYDTYGRTGLVGEALETLARNPRVRRIAVFSLDLTPALVAEAREAGAVGFISKALSAEQIVQAVVRVAEDEDVIAMTPSHRPAVEALDWPGKEAGLTERQSEVLVLVGEGLSNREVAATLYLSPHTVKSYVQDIYARMGFRNRVDAAKYVAESGAFDRHPRGAPR